MRWRLSGGNTAVFKEFKNSVGYRTASLFIIESIGLYFVTTPGILFRIILLISKTDIF